MKTRGIRRPGRPPAAPLSRQQREMVLPTVRRLALDEKLTDPQIVAYFAKHGPFPLTRSQVEGIRKRNRIMSMNDTVRNARAEQKLHLGEGIREAFVTRIRDLAAEQMSDRQIAEALGHGLTRGQIADLRAVYNIRAGRPGPVWINHADRPDPAPVAAAEAAAAPAVELPRPVDPQRRIKHVNGAQAHCDDCQAPVDAYTNDRAIPHKRLSPRRVNGLRMAEPCPGTGRFVRWELAGDELAVAA